VVPVALFAYLLFGSTQRLPDLLDHATSFIHGRVFFRETAKPVVGARIRPQTLSYQGVACTEGMTDTNGNFRVKALPGRWVLALILGPKLSSDFTYAGAPNIDLRQGEDFKVDLQVFRGNKIYGVIRLPSGKPAAGASVQAVFEGQRGGQSPFVGANYTLVGPDGKYKFNLPSGPFSLISECRTGGLIYQKTIGWFNVSGKMHRDIDLIEDLKWTKFVKEHRQKKSH